MSPASATPTSSLDHIISSSVFRAGEFSAPGFREMLDGLPAAVYTTDAQGVLTYFNPACIDFSGRTPFLGTDRWCVTWKLYHADGTPMPHDQCPMAIALREGPIMSGIEAIAERPDGSRVWFQPHPTILRDAAGKITGGINMLVDITESKRREADGRALAALGSQMVTVDEPRAIYEKIVDAAVSLMHSDFASMQFFHPDRGEVGELELLAHRGFDPAGAKFWQWVGGKSTCICGLALRAGTRVVISDAAHSDRLDERQKNAYRQTGIGSMQSTPLVSRSGKLLGMISTHWRRPHQPGESEFSNFDILARQAADLIERSQAEQAIRQNEAWLAAQKEALQSALNGQPLEHSLGLLVRGAIDRFGPQARAAFYRANADGTTLHHITGMSPEYAQIIDGFKIAPESLSCGLATHTGKPVLTADVREEPRWLPWLSVAERFDFRGCWSFPLNTSQGQILGSLAVYWQTPREALPPDVAFANAVADTAAIIIARHTESEVRKRAEENLRRAKEEAEAANIAKDNFIASLSHELRTPLTPVLATLSIWENDGIDLPHALREDLSMLRRNVELEARLIDDLLDLTRIARGKIALNCEVVDVQKLLDAVVAMYQSDIRAKKINFSSTTRTRNCFVRADPGRVQQVLWHVQKNAVKFTPEAGRIDVTTRIDGQRRIEIVVTDNGAGISPDMLKRLFQPFEQETAGRYGGLGLGLAITKALLEAQEGTIEAKSDGIGSGASFVMTLPCVEQPAAKYDNRPLASTPADAPARPENCYRVLLVEDHQDTARALGRLLRGNGHDVQIVHSIADALEALRHKSVEVLVSDIGLPDGTGIDLIRQVRETHRLNIPAIALTGFGMEEDVKRTRAAGFSDHLTKPVNLVKLEEAIQRVCASHNPTTRSA